MLRNLVANGVPNLTDFGQRFAEISANEFNGAVFLAHMVVGVPDILIGCST